MNFYKTFEGGRVNLEHKKGYPIVQHAFEILGDDCEARDLDEFDNIYFKLFAKAGGKLLATIEMDFGGSPDNLVYLSDDSAITSQRAPREYWHEVYGVSGSPEVAELLFKGVSLLEP